METLQNQNVLLFTRTMGLGGTENVVLQLCEILNPVVNKVVVCSCGGVNEKRLQTMGIKHYTIPDIEKKDLKTILPSIIVGSAVGAGLGMIHGVECMVPHGGLIVIAAVNKAPMWYAIDMAIGVVVTAICLHLLRPDIEPDVKK